MSDRIIYITPFIDETKRIKEQCPKRNFVLPDSKAGRGSKLTHLKELLKQKKNIASTHALFLMIDEEVTKLFRENNYILVLDEVLNIIDDSGFYKDAGNGDTNEKEKIVRKDMKILQEQGFVTVDDYFKVHWNEGVEALSQYENFKQAVEKEQIYYVTDAYLLWVFPSRIFKDTFKEIFVMTYQFDFQLQACYFKYFDIPYEKFGIIKTMGSNSEYRFKKVSYDKYLEYDKLQRVEMKKLMDICDSDILNCIGNKKRTTSRHDAGLSLSSTGYKNMSSEDFDLIRKKATSYQKNYLKDRTSSVMWTTYKDYENNIRFSKNGKSGKVRLTEKSFVNLSCRATNEYRDRSGLIYLLDRYPLPFFNHMLSKKNVSIDADEFALAEMLQWIFRSAIRDGKPIQIYIPSERMRNLLTRWLDGEF
ncbi:hypothetical protein [Acetobacterium woodii]|nr:hypothetical protein [Acetobacterium woodii]